MSGYLDNPEANKAAFKGGMFHSGDAAVMHADGYIQIKDRFKDVIISGGENISSVAVEAGVSKHPSILMCAVVSMPHEKWGETPCCFFEVKDGQTAPSEDELKAHCKATLPRYMCPGKFVQHELPKTSTGKIQKYVLREKAKQFTDAAPVLPGM
jgi:fatty-acyl-CoA synthase